MIPNFCHTQPTSPKKVPLVLAVKVDAAVAVAVAVVVYGSQTLTHSHPDHYCWLPHYFMGWL